MAKKKIHIMNTAFRDGFQSAFGARVFTKDFMPAVEACVDAGITTSRRAAARVSSRSSSTATKARST